MTSLPSLFELVNPLEKQGTRLRAGCGYIGVVSKLGPTDDY